MESFTHNLAGKARIGGITSEEGFEIRGGFGVDGEKLRGNFAATLRDNGSRVGIISG